MRKKAKKIFFNNQKKRKKICKIFKKKNFSKKKFSKKLKKKMSGFICKIAHHATEHLFIHETTHGINIQFNSPTSYCDMMDHRGPCCDGGKFQKKPFYAPPCQNVPHNTFFPGNRLNCSTKTNNSTSNSKSSFQFSLGSKLSNSSTIKTNNNNNKIGGINAYITKYSY